MHSGADKLEGTGSKAGVGKRKGGAFDPDVVCESDSGKGAGILYQRISDPAGDLGGYSPAGPGVGMGEDDFVFAFGNCGDIFGVFGSASHSHTRRDFFVG